MTNRMAVAVLLLLALSTLRSCEARRELKAQCGKVDDLCRDAIPTLSWGAQPPLPTCCESGTTCTFISRYSRCLKNNSNCATAYGIITNWQKWSGAQSNPFSTTLKILRRAGLIDRLKTAHSKTFFAPTDAAWQVYKKAKGEAAHNRFLNDKEHVAKWLKFVLIPDAVGNGGGLRVYQVGKMVVDYNLYRITGPANAGQLANVISDWKCTDTPKRDYVLDTDVVFEPCTCGTPAPWDPPSSNSY